jgi:RND family efflux transporter MFP subunit
MLLTEMSPDKATLDALRIDRAGAPARRGGRGTAVLVASALVLAAVVVAIALIWWFNRPAPIVVRTVVVQEPTAANEAKTLLNASGYVTARREATVSSKVTGKVVEILVEEGMRVEANQVLARIDASNVEKSLRWAEAQLESARKALGETKANLEYAEREFQRVSQLAEVQAESQNTRDRAESDAKALRARLEKQMAEIEVAERDVAIKQQELDDTVIRAPFAGIVTTKNAQPGEMISPMSVGGFTRTGICTIVDMSSLEIEVDVSESYINRVESGQPVQATLDSYPGWQIPARVIAIIPTADRQKATVKVRVGFDKLDPRILPDMSVKVAFQSAADATTTTAATTTTTRAAPRSITVPKAAVRQGDGSSMVWVVRDGRAQRRAVTSGAPIGDSVSIAAGISGGERVVVEAEGGFDRLSDGAAVTEAKR